MRRVCPCGKPATHRVVWDQFLEVSEPKPSTRPAWCYACAREEAVRNTALRKEREDVAAEFDWRTRETFETTTPVPVDWRRIARQVIRRHGAAINPGGLVELYAQRGHLLINVYPPHERPASWDPEKVLFLIRYLARRPLVFRRVRHAPNPSVPGRRALREQWASTLPPVVERVHCTSTAASPSEDDGTS